VIRKQKDVCF
jgi:hypothetical protein